ncbi:hypothetical protein N9W89_07620 [Hellea sp.]|nr:hypothetical protein [Hellea sp.]
MNIQTPIETIQKHILNKQIEAKADDWDIEKTLLEFEVVTDTLDVISDGLPDDPKVTNALNGIHDELSKLYSDFKTRLM